MLVNKSNKTNRQKVTKGPVKTNEVGLVPNRFTALMDKEPNSPNREDVTPSVVSETSNLHI